MKLVMGFFALAFLSLMTVGASAQTPDRQQPAASIPSQTNVEQQHPEWFTERYRYKPCPAEVEFPDGRQACLGMGGR
jgi:hypothetical protein